MNGNDFSILINIVIINSKIAKAINTMCIITFGENINIKIILWIITEINFSASSMCWLTPVSWLNISSVKYSFAVRLS